ANAIRTAYLRAGLFPEPYPTRIRNLLRQYVDVRLEGVHPEKVEQAIRKSEEFHGRLWSQAVALGHENSPPPFPPPLAPSVNEVISLHPKRIRVGARSRIPDVIWLALYFVAALAMAGVGYHAGLTATSRSLAIMGLALTFSAILVLIADLDRPWEGLLQVS